MLFIIMNIESSTTLDSGNEDEDSRPEASNGAAEWESLAGESRPENQSPADASGQHVPAKEQPAFPGEWGTDVWFWEEALRRENEEAEAAGSGSTAGAKSTGQSGEKDNPSHNPSGHRKSTASKHQNPNSATGSNGPKKAQAGGNSGASSGRELKLQKDIAEERVLNNNPDNLSIAQQERRRRQREYERKEAADGGAKPRAAEQKNQNGPKTGGRNEILPDDYHGPALIQTENGPRQVTLQGKIGEHKGKRHYRVKENNGAVSEDKFDVAELLSNRPDSRGKESTDSISDTYVGPAIRNGNGEDSPTEITGYAGEYEGERYFFVEGSRAAVPESRLFLRPQLEAVAGGGDAGPEKQGGDSAGEGHKLKERKPEIDRDNILYEFSPEEQWAKDYIEEKENGIDFFDDSTEVGRNLKQARERLAEATVAARRGKLGSNAKNQQEMDSAIAKYENAREKFIKEQASKVRNIDPARRHALVTMLGTKETGALMGEEANHYLSQNHPGRFDRLVNGYNNLSPKRKLATGLGIAAAGGVVSAWVGVAAAGAGAGAAISTRFGRNYFSQEAKRRGLSRSEQEKQQDSTSYAGNLDQYRTDHDAIKNARTRQAFDEAIRAESLHDRAGDAVEDESNKEARSKRKAFAKAVGVTATFGLAAEHGPDAWEWISDRIGGGGAGEQAVPDAETPAPQPEPEAPAETAPDPEPTPETAPADISAELGLPEGYIVDTPGGYEVTAMPGGETDSIWRAAEHALEHHLGRQPNVFETDALQDILGTHRLDVGETVSVTNEQIDQALRTAAQYTAQ